MAKKNTTMMIIIVGAAILFFMSGRSRFDASVSALRNQRIQEGIERGSRNPDGSINEDYYAQYGYTM